MCRLWSIIYIKNAFWPSCGGGGRLVSADTIESTLVINRLGSFRFKHTFKLLTFPNQSFCFLFLDSMFIFWFDSFNQVNRPYLIQCFPLSLLFQEPIKSRAPQLHLEYRFYKQLGNSGERHRLCPGRDLSRSKCKSPNAPFRDSCSVFTVSVHKLSCTNLDISILYVPVGVRDLWQHIYSFCT